MKKKVSRKHTPARKAASHHRHKHPYSYSISYIISLGTAIVGVLLIVFFFSKANSKVHVLGDATGPLLLADQQDQPDQQNFQSHGDQPSPMPQENQQNSFPSPKPSEQPQVSIEQHPPSETLVDCVGPDGKHFTTSFHDCQDINKQQNTFQFTPLSRPSENTTEGIEPTGQPTGEPMPTGQEHQNTQTLQGHLEAQIDGSKREFNLETEGVHIEMKKEDDGSIKIVAHKSDGKEVQLQTSALDQINEALKEKNLEVSSSTTGFAIKSDGVQAETNLPVTVDPTTKSLAVTTAQGTQDITTLPNQAVQNALQQGHLTNVLSTANQTTPNATSANNTVALTDLNNEPVYAVQGVQNKNLLGLFPVAFRKTVFVSAQDGQVVKTQQSVFNQFLQALSF